MIRRYLARRRHRRMIHGVYRYVLSDLMLLRALYPEVCDFSRQQLVREILHDYRPAGPVRLAPVWAEQMESDAS